MNGTKTWIKKIPYGVSDYNKIVTGHYYYVDKTPFLKTIEDASDYLFFIRPRRFGKSLLLSMMEAYYDVAYKDQFAELFADTAIFENPTGEQGLYLVLSFNFSLVESAQEKVEESFLTHVKGVAQSFISKYHPYLLPQREEYTKTIEGSRSASDILSTLIRLCKDSHQKVYAFIDECDNFANTTLSTVSKKAYYDLTHGQGFFRSFFNILKGGTSGMDAPFDRLFITGVSPITLDDVTSGFNIGENISTDPAFNQMLGFTRADVEKIIEHYQAAGFLNHSTDVLLEIMGLWYDNYRFSQDEYTSMFNTDMVLYFLKECAKIKSLPRDLIDANVRIDYGKLRHLIIVDKKGKSETNGNFSRLREIVEEGAITSKIIKAFPLEELNTPENFTSLLFYFGLLTITGEKEGIPLLSIPNQTVKTLFYDYIIRISQDIHLLDANIRKLETLLHDMAYHGNWQAFFDYFCKRMDVSTSIRDFFLGEKVIQGFLLAYLGISDYFIVHSEKELNKGYADIVMEPFLARYEDMKYSFLIEIKYFSSPQTKTKTKTKKDGSLESKIAQLKKEAERQLRQYSGDEGFDKTIGKTTLIKLVLIFSGSELVYIGESGEEIK